MGVDYLQVFGATGGVEPYAFVLASGVLPPGLMLSPHGFIAGTPTVAGTYGFTMVATGQHACTGANFMHSSSTPPPVRRSCSRLHLCRAARRASSTARSFWPRAAWRLTPSRWPRGSCPSVSRFLQAGSSPGRPRRRDLQLHGDRHRHQRGARGACSTHSSSTPRLSDDPARAFASAERHGGRP